MLRYIINPTPAATIYLMNNCLLTYHGNGVYEYVIINEHHERMFDEACLDIMNDDVDPVTLLHDY